MNWIHEHAGTMLGGGFLWLSGDTWFGLLLGLPIGFATNLFVARMSRFAELRDDALQIVEAAELKRCQESESGPNSQFIFEDDELVYLQMRYSRHPDELNLVINALLRLGHSQAVGVVAGVSSEMTRVIFGYSSSSFFTPTNGTMQPGGPTKMTAKKLGFQHSHWQYALRTMKPDFFAICSLRPRV